jgi:fructokinase
MLRTGIDLGGSKIEIACFGDDNSIVLRERIPTPQGDYRGTVMAVAGLVEGCGAKSRRPQYGGCRHTRGRVAGKRLGQERQFHLPDRQTAEAATCNAALQREVRLANDANCFALSEAVDGAGAPARPWCSA